MSSMIVHGYNANDLLSSTVISIPKNTRGDMSQIDNYRGISFCNCICKLFDVIILKKCDNVLKTSDQQFAFKQNHSTALCSVVLIETVNHFVKSESNVYSCFLDASKAFDKVHYGKLFKLLISKGLPNVIVRFILDGYTRQSVRVQWDGVHSRNFNTFNGVKQGGVISPILFAIYYDELIARLSNSRYGCRLSGKFVGALAYADDITLISPSLYGLQQMVNICTDFGAEYHVTFNDKKTVGIAFGTSAAGCKAIRVNGTAINWSNQVKHLGNVIDCNLTDVADSNTKKGHFIASVNWFVSHFSDKVPLDCYTRLFQTYCSSHYGSVLWELHDKGFNGFCVTWNKGVRRVLNVPSMTHTALLGPLINTCHISVILVKRFCKFIDTMLASDNEIIRLIIRRALLSAQSPIGRNIAILRSVHSIRVRYTCKRHAYMQALQKACSKVHVSDTVLFVRELLRIRNNEICVSEFTRPEIATLIEYLCIY